ncbi:MAG: hypothetical protein ACYC2H_08110 [Thermoplasmatota archaeon]
MPASALLPQANLDAEAVKAMLAPRLRATDRIVGKSLFFTDFAIRRSGSVGVAVKVVPGPHGTEVRLSGFAPSLGLRLVKAWVLALFLRGKWRRMEEEVAALLKASTTPAVASRVPRSPAAPAPTPGIRRPGTVSCPKCKAPVPAPANRPATLACPRCGFSGTLR